MRSAYKSKIKQLFGDDKADKFDALYGLRSNFLHDGSGRDSLGDAADACVYRKPRFGSNGDEVHQGSGVNERFRSDESDEKSAHPCAKTNAF